MINKGKISLSQYMINSQISNWRGIYLGLATCLIFFNPFHSNNEIFPFWLLFLPLIFKRLPVFIFCLTTLSLGLLNYLLYSESRAIIDCLSIISTFIGLLIYSSLNKEEKRSLCNIFIIFIILTFIVMIIQKFNPQFHDFILELFSSRNDLSSYYIKRNGAVTGFSPEPAYGSAMITGLMLILFLNHRLSNYIYILILIELYLFRSITGIIYFIYTSVIIASTDLKIFLKHKYLLLALLVLFGFFFRDDFLSFINRPKLFIDILFSGGSLVEAESIFGSSRLINVLDAFKLFDPSYSTGFSPFAVFSNLSHTFLIPVIILLIYASANGNIRNIILSLPYLIFGGPVLLWPLQVFLFEKIKK
jgi:hypothetical protein